MTNMAWLKLCQWFDGQKSKASIDHHVMKEFQSLILEKHTIGGAEAYISKFDEAMFSFKRQEFLIQKL